MTTVSMTIDGTKVQAEQGTTVLKAAKGAGIHIPTQCYDERMDPAGACRLCMVEIEKGKRKRLVASCCYPAEEGLVVNTRNEKIDKIRRVISELLLPLSPNGEHEKVAKELGVKESRFKLDENPDSPCTLCGLCVRYCREVKGANAVTFVGRGANRRVELVPGASSACKSCKECFTFCDAGKMVYLVDNLIE
jgi:NADH dehydrogenase/NADH:ubiquinone oxidoreductase subunit G